MTDQSTPPPSPRPQGKRERSPEPGGEAPVAPVAPVAPQPRPRPAAGTAIATADRPPVAARRSVPRWAWVAAVVVVLLGVVGYEVVSSYGGGAVKVGETFTHQSGLGLTVTSPRRFDTADASMVGPGEQAYQVVVDVDNNSTKVIAPADIHIFATVGGRPTEAIYPDGPLTQAVEPGVQLNVPFRFKVKTGTTGPLQVTVNTPAEKSVYFNGAI